MKPALRMMAHNAPAGMVKAPVVLVVVTLSDAASSGEVVTDTPDKLAAGTAIPTGIVLHIVGSGAQVEL